MMVLNNRRIPGRGGGLGMYTEVQRSAIAPSLTIREGELDTCKPCPRQSFQTMASSILIGCPVDQPVSRRGAEVLGRPRNATQGLGRWIIGAGSQGLKLSFPLGWTWIPTRQKGEEVGDVIETG